MGFIVSCLGQSAIPTHARRHCTVHDVQSFVKLLLNNRLGKHEIAKHTFPAQVPFGDFFIVRAVTQPRTQDLQSGNEPKITQNSENLRAITDAC